jgi:predicted ATP-dependent endonuclease of OLD family
MIKNIKIKQYRKLKELEFSFDDGINVLCRIKLARYGD